MITNWWYQSNGWRPELNPDWRIIDIGGANSFAQGKLNAIVDIREPQAEAAHKFVGDIDMPEIWKSLWPFSRWDYAICTHTLEDINNPLLVSRQIQTFSNRGFIAVPSRFRELSRFSGSFRGYIHHRWIFDVIDGVLTAFPKINYIEDEKFDAAVNYLDGRDELCIEWTGSIDMKIINDGMPYGTAEISGEEHIKQLYSLLTLPPSK